MFDGDDLRRVYIVDISPGMITSMGAVEIPIILANMDTLDPEYELEDTDTVGLRVKAFPLNTPEEILQLVKESKPEMCHITNACWDIYDSWGFLKTVESVNMSFHDFSREEITDALQKATDITIMFEMINTGELTLENLESYLKEHNIWKEV